VKGEAIRMKSLVRSAKAEPVTDNATQRKPSAESGKAEQAQCCAKVSQTVAGCHD
jgi:hypothetical protein